MTSTRTPSPPALECLKKNPDYQWSLPAASPGWLTGNPTSYNIAIRPAACVYKSATSRRTGFGL